jgi:tRNA (cmo5U34)-methyltransferase
MPDTNVNLWTSTAHALDYLARADAIPHRTEGEAALIEWLPRPLLRVLDLGTGDGRLLALVKLARPEAEAVAVDFSDTMLARVRERFAGNARVTVVAHDLNRPLPKSLGTFTGVVSSFAIHHLPDARKRAIYQEVFGLLEPGGVFANLEHVASPTVALHRRFLEALGVEPESEDPSNKLLALEAQLEWLRDMGFEDVDCHWKWRELALMVGVRASASGAWTPSPPARR